MLNDQGRFGQGLSNTDPAAADDSNRRADQRHMSVFRVGKLITSRGQELCLIRNISSGGLMAHVYSPHDAQEQVEIELKAGKTVKGLVVWARDRKIGVQFDEKIDVADVLAPQPGESDQIARAPRLNIRRRGRIRLGAHYQLIEIQDISQGGCKFGPAGDAKVDDEIILLLEGLPPLTGIVRWCREDMVGLTFKTAIPFEQLAAWAPGNR
jgi:hypothetical protein